MMLERRVRVGALVEMSRYEQCKYEPGAAGLFRRKLLGKGY
jgi:hypothetical protein